MEESNYDNESLTARIHQLEKERDALHKDVEQLCMQQAGPGYLGVATRMHFQRTAGLEQEIESLKQKLAAFTRENQNLREELSEAYHVKSQLADLHNAEVAKNIEAEQQLKFFQGCVGAAFSERDNALMEAEKSKEKEELMSEELNKVQKRFEDLTSEILEERGFLTKLRIDLEKQEKQNETFRKVIDKFYDSQEHGAGSQDISYEDKCMYLLCDTEETSTSKQKALEEEIESLRASVDSLQNQQRVGVQIENHLQKRIRDLEKGRRALDEKIVREMSILHSHHSQQRANIMNVLDEEYSFMKSTINKVEENIKLVEFGKSKVSVSPQSEDLDLPQSECRDVHINSDTGLDSPLPERVNPVACSPSPEPDDTCDTLAQGLQEKGKELSLASKLALETGDSSEALAQALQEKVATLLLLSQQEERYLLERNVQAAQQKKIEELQRNLLQVTNEKVKALMELAQMKQNYLLLQEKTSEDHENTSTESGQRRIIHERDGKFRNLIKNSYLNRWVGAKNSNESNIEAPQNHGGIFSTKHSNFDVASMKIEYATLKESLESMEYLTSSTQRLRLSLLKVKQASVENGTRASLSESLDQIISEAMQVKTALGSSLPVSWSGELDSSVSSSHSQEEVDNDADSSVPKVDFVSAAGFEMVELLIFAAQVLKDRTVDRFPQSVNPTRPASTPTIDLYGFVSLSQ